MTAPEGAFYPAGDAEIDCKEGQSYLWSHTEISEILGTADAERFFAAYQLTAEPTEPAGPGVLRVHTDRMATIKERVKLGREF